jgi:glycosyltransferase involved in cell wall biosynthesis
MRQPITVAIVTRNRANDLQECLSSLTRQSLAPEKVLIINNNSSDHTKDVIRKFSRILSIGVVLEKNIGYPAVYNRATREVKTRWIAFIDDDCVADRQWFYNLTKATKRFHKYAAIAGTSLNYYSTNCYACAFQFSYEYWRHRSVDKTKVLDYRTLDSRNIAYNLPLLFRHRIRFDEQFTVGAEDSDMGMQIQHNMLKAAYIAEMIIFHKEPKTFASYFRKKQTQARALLRLIEKWGDDKPPFGAQGRWKLLKKTLRSTTRHLTIAGTLAMGVLILIDYIIFRFYLYTLTERGRCGEC